MINFSDIHIVEKRIYHHCINKTKISSKMLFVSLRFRFLALQWHFGPSYFPQDKFFFLHSLGTNGLLYVNMLLGRLTIGLHFV